MLTHLKHRFANACDRVGVQNKLISYRITASRSLDIEFTPKNNEVAVTEKFDAEGTNADD